MLYTVKPRLPVVSRKGPSLAHTYFSTNCSFSVADDTKSEVAISILKSDLLKTAKWAVRNSMALDATKNRHFWSSLFPTCLLPNQQDTHVPLTQAMAKKNISFIVQNIRNPQAQVDASGVCLHTFEASLSDLCS